MRILYMHQYFVTPSMAGGTRSYDMAKRLASAGHDVVVLTTARGESRNGDERWVQEEIDGFDVEWCHVAYSNKMGFWRRLRAFIEFAWLAGSRAIELQGDLVFATSTPLTIAIPAVRAARKLRIPMVFEVRDLWPELPIAMGIIRNPLLKFLGRQLERYAYRNARHIVALSPGMADGVAATGYARESITIIPNSSNNDLFGDADDQAVRFYERFPDYRETKLVIYSGALGEANGVEYLVRIAHAMQNEDATVGFLIAGEGKRKANIEALAEQLGVLGQNLRIIAPIPKAEMPALLGAAAVASSLLIDLPAMANSSPNKFFDALASGTPIMINWKGWLADLVLKSGAGIVIPPDDSVAAAKLLCEFINDSTAIESARQNAAALARESFDKNRLADRLVGVLESCGKD